MKLVRIDRRHRRGEACSPGDPKRGEQIFFKHPAAACVLCHCCTARAAPSARRSMASPRAPRPPTSRKPARAEQSARQRLRKPRHLAHAADGPDPQAAGAGGHPGVFADAEINTRGNPHVFPNSPLPARTDKWWPIRNSRGVTPVRLRKHQPLCYSGSRIGITMLKYVSAILLMLR